MNGRRQFGKTWIVASVTCLPNVAADARMTPIRASIVGPFRSETNIVKITWDYATEIRRDDPLIMQIGTSLGLTTDDSDR
jgi:hypothetical protein